MAYLKKILDNDEIVLFKARQTKIIMIFPILIIIFASITSVLYKSEKIYFYASIALLGLSLLWLFIEYLKYISTLYLITNKRILVKTGLLTFTTTEIILQKIETIKVKQNILGRIFNYGNIEIIGSGGTNEEFIQLNAPLKFRKKIQQQIEQKFNNQNNNLDNNDSDK